MSTDEADRLHTSATELLRSRGHRYTGARQRVVALLDRATAPLTIPQLLEIDDALTQSTAYRAIAVLEEAGVATRIVTADDHARYELDERVTRRHHHHLICTDCGHVEDFELSDDLERTLDEELQLAGQMATFKVDRHRLDALGSCASCS
ncbi:MAG: Fur family transcriptional regulator [Acidimicrobiales bacterium]